MQEVGTVAEDGNASSVAAPETGVGARVAAPAVAPAVPGAGGYGRSGARAAEWWLGGGAGRRR